MAGSYSHSGGLDADPYLILGTQDRAAAFMSMLHAHLEEKLFNALEGDELARLFKSDEL